MQTIPGSGGAIKTPLAKYLLKNTKDVLLVNRNPQKADASGYVFDISKFKNKFGFKPASFEAGIKEVFKSDYK